jgi:hypothetical protein
MPSRTDRLSVSYSIAAFHYSYQYLTAQPSTALQRGKSENTQGWLMTTRNAAFKLLLAFVIAVSGSTGVVFASTSGVVDDPGVSERGPPAQVENGSDANESNTSNTSNGSAETTFSTQQSYGSTVTINEVNLSQGGFVAVRNETGVNDTLIGVSRYLAPGSYDDLQVRLYNGSAPNSSQSRLNGTQELIAVVHRDTNGDRQFDFVEGGGTDSPFVRNGSTVQNPANVSVIGPASLAGAPPTADIGFTSQSTDGRAITVDEANLSQGGFVAVHRGRGTSGPIIGVSQYLDAGGYQDVQVQLFNVPGQRSSRTSLGRTQNLTAVPYLDTNNNTRYDYVQSNGSADVPYLNNGGAVTNPTTIRVTNTSPGSTTSNTSSAITASPATQTGGASTPGTGTSIEDSSTAVPSTTAAANAGIGTDRSPTSTGTGGDQTETTGPGFGITTAVLALFALVGVGTYRHD